MVVMIVETGREVEEMVTLPRSPIAVKGDSR